MFYGVTPYGSVSYGGLTIYLNSGGKSLLCRTTVLKLASSNLVSRVIGRLVTGKNLASAVLIYVRGATTIHCGVYVCWRSGTIDVPCAVLVCVRSGANVPCAVAVWVRSATDVSCEVCIWKWKRAYILDYTTVAWKEVAV